MLPAGKMIQTEPMSRETEEPEVPASRLPVLRWWWVASAALGVAVLAGAFVWLLIANVRAEQNSAQASAELDAIRTGLSVTIGAGGAFALWLSARRQRSTEIQIIESARIAAETRVHQEAVSALTELDSRERRVTELYTTAVDQLGSERAPVRLGALYSLERLAQQNEDHRQTIVSVICAYLRMPFKPPREELVRRSPGADSTIPDVDDLRRMEELQVRLTAQRILADHLSPPLDSSKVSKAWGPLDLDLRGAVLVDFNFRRCVVDRADFAYCIFHGTSDFSQTTFGKDAWFFECTFGGNVHFRGATFHGRAIFTRSLFVLMLLAFKAVFHANAVFVGATFGSRADFSASTFALVPDFSECKLSQSHFDDFGFTKNGGWDGPRFKFDGAKVRESNPGSNMSALPAGWRIAQIDSNGELASAEIVKDAD